MFIKAVSFINIETTDMFITQQFIIIYVKVMELDTLCFTHLILIHD